VKNPEVDTFCNCANSNKLKRTKLILGKVHPKYSILALLKTYILEPLKETVAMSLRNGLKTTINTSKENTLRKLKKKQFAATTEKKTSLI
jgi:hypothetical protein